MTARFFSALALVVLLTAAPAKAQQQGFTGFGGVADLSLSLGVPTRDFADKLDQFGYGGSLFVGAHLGRSPVVLGVDVAFLIYGRDTDRVPFSNPVGPRVPVDVVTTNSILQPHLALRLQPPTGRVRPYVEALGGFKYLFTQTRIEDVDFRDDREIASDTNFDDFAWSGGAGAGLDIQVFEGLGGAGGRFGALSLHLGVQYLFGQEAEYLGGGALRDDDRNGRLDRGELDIRRSRTDLVVPRVGLGVQF